MKATILAIALAALVTLAPMAVGQGTQDYNEDDDSGYEGGPLEVTMYHHVYNLLDKVPMNTQQMDPAVPDLTPGGFLTPTIEEPSGSFPSAQNFLFMYNSPGPVHYNTSLREPRFHPERGLAEDLHLAAQPMTTYWYMSADADDTIAEGPTNVGAMPHVTVRATLRLGDDVGGNLDNGEIVSQGEITVDVITEPNGPPMEIAIPMEAPRITTIPKEESFNLKIEWFQVDQTGVQAMDRQWNLHTGPQFPNRLVFTIENPLRINYVHPQPIGDRKIAFHTAFVTPFGNYDVDLDKLQFQVQKADGTTISPKSLQGPIIVQKDWVHNHHFEPVLATWVWNYRADNADPGSYTISVETANYQGSALATKAARFNIAPEGKATGFSSSGEEIAGLDADADEGTNDSPFGIAPVLVAALVAVAVATYRRRT